MIFFDRLIIFPPCYHCDFPTPPSLDLCTVTGQGYCASLFYGVLTLIILSRVSGCHRIPMVKSNAFQLFKAFLKSYVFDYLLFPLTSPCMGHFAMYTYCSATVVEYFLSNSLIPGDIFSWFLKYFGLEFVSYKQKVFQAMWRQTRKLCNVSPTLVKGHCHGAVKR